MRDYSFIVDARFLPHLSASDLSAAERAVVFACALLASPAYVPVPFAVLDTALMLSDRMMLSALRSLLARDVLRAYIPV